MEGPDYNGFDFYCADCPPPPGKENVQMPPPLTRKKPLMEETAKDMISLKHKAATGKNSPSATITPANTSLNPTTEATKKLLSGKTDAQVSITPTNQSRTAAQKWPNLQQSPPSALPKSKSLKRPISDVSPATINSTSIGTNNKFSNGNSKSKAGLSLGGTTTLTPVSRQHGALGGAVSDGQAVSANKKVTPLRPIEAQAVINIGGIKYLVVPHPTAPSAEMKSSSQQQTPSANKKARPSVSRTNSCDSPVGPATDVNKLPFLLRPAAENLPSGDGDSHGLSNPPTFEIEETADGKLVLTPISQNGGTNIPECMKSKKQDMLRPGEESNKVKQREPVNQYQEMNSEQFTYNLSRGYFAMLNVFRYLTPQERAKSGRVCKLWKELSHHPSLWESVSLRNCRIYNWMAFARHLNRTHAQNLDVRKILHIVDKNESGAGGLSVMDRQAVTWTQFAEAAPLLANLARLEMPKIRASDLQRIISEIASSSQPKVN